MPEGISACFVLPGGSTILVPNAFSPNDVQGDLLANDSDEEAAKQHTSGFRHNMKICLPNSRPGPLLRVLAALASCPLDELAETLLLTGGHHPLRVFEAARRFTPHVSRMIEEALRHELDLSSTTEEWPLAMQRLCHWAPLCHQLCQTSLPICLGYEHALSVILERFLHTDFERNAGCMFITLCRHHITAQAAKAAWLIVTQALLVVNTTTIVTAIFAAVVLQATSIGNQAQDDLHDAVHDALKRVAPQSWAVRAQHIRLQIHQALDAAKVSTAPFLDALDSALQHIGPDAALDSQRCVFHCFSGPSPTNGSWYSQQSTQTSTQFRLL